MKNILAISIFIFTFFFHSCGEKKQVVKVEKLEPPQSYIVPAVTEESTNDEENALKIQKIDSLHYFNLKSKIDPKPEIRERVTDLKTAQKMLAGIVEFTDYGYEKEKDMIKKITFRNGKQLENEVDFTEAVFVAFFPSEDILLMEGGHQTDRSYNLKNGDQTDDTGNPEVMSTSPTGKYRLNGNYDGQQCYSYFIQKKRGTEFKKINAFDKILDKASADWLCVIGESFWSDDHTIYLRETSNFSEDGSNNLYYKMTIQ